MSLRRSAIDYDSLAMVKFLFCNFSVLEYSALFWTVPASNALHTGKSHKVAKVGRARPHITIFGILKPPSHITPCLSYHFIIPYLSHFILIRICHHTSRDLFALSKFLHNKQP